MPNHAKTLDILLTLPLAETSASNSLKSKDTKLLCVGKIFANLQVRSTRTVRVGSDRRAFLVHWQYFLIGIRGNILSDAPLLRCLCRRAAASSARSSASALRDGGPCAASGSSVLSTASIILFARSGRRRPQPCTPFAVPTRHFSRFSPARRRRFHRFPALPRLEAAQHLPPACGAPCAPNNAAAIAAPPHNGFAGP